MSLTLNLGNDGNFLVTDPTGHTLQIPATEAGLSLIRTILIKRQNFSGEPPLGSDARPLQSMIQAYLATHGVTTKTRPALPAKYANLDLEIDL